MMTKFYIGIGLIICSVLVLIYSWFLWRSTSVFATAKRAEKAIRAGRQGPNTGAEIAREMKRDRVLALVFFWISSILLLCGSGFILYHYFA